MSRIGVFVACIVAIVALASPSARAADLTEAPTLGGAAPDQIEVRDAGRIPGRYIVVFEDSVSNPGSVARAHVSSLGARLGTVYRVALRGYVASGLSRQDVESLGRDPRVAFVEADRRIELEAQTTPTGIKRISALDNAYLDIDGQDDVRVDADVAVIDTGIDPQHADLNVAGRTSCVAPPAGGPACVDGAGTYGGWHGTHVAGAVGAVDNDLGVVGVAPGARLWSVQVFDDEGNGQSSWTLAAIEWVTAHADQIEVANMSLSASGRSPAQEQAIAASVEAGVVYVVAAGNQSENAGDRRPANGPDVITVSALADYDGLAGGAATTSPCSSPQGPDDTHATFSNWGAVVDISAPGVCVYSTLPGSGYGYSYGTSFATPHVAGAAAVMASRSNPQTRQDVEAIRSALIDGGSLAWNDTSADTAPEPLLYLGEEPLAGAEAATGGFSNATEGVAILHGAVNPRGLASRYEFQYGLTTDYGNRVPAAGGALAADAGYTAVTETIENLEPGQTYHYRLAIVNASGTFYGVDRTFTVPTWQGAVKIDQPAAATADWLNDVDCITGACMAVGYYYEGGSTPASYRPEDGAWRFAPLQKPAGSGSMEAYGVSCASPASCVAVGRVEIAGQVLPLVERWNGESWAVEQLAPPYPNAPYTRLLDVSCVSGTECVAVGQYRDAGGTYRTYSAIRKGGQWLGSPAPTAADWKVGEFEDVSCVAIDSCVAVGWYNSTQGGARPVVARWNGSSWALGAAARQEGTLYGVDCVTASFCVAVGGGGGLSAEAWDGAKWSPMSIGLSGESGTSFQGVSCRTTSSCTAVGGIRQMGRELHLVANWDGSGWHREESRRQAEQRGFLASVACRALVGCHAVGASKDEWWSGPIETRHDVVTRPATDVRPTTATLNGRVDPGGVPTTYRFEYGKTTNYGSSAPQQSVSIGSGTGPGSVSQVVEGLAPETVYHFRLTASNADGTVLGAAGRFETGATAPVHRATFGSLGTAKGQFNRPMGTAVDAEGNVWVADRENNRIQKFNANGEYLWQFGTTGSGNGQLRKPTDIAFTASGDMWVTDAENDRVQKFSPNGAYLGQFGSSGSGNGRFGEPAGIATAPNGDIWVTDGTLYNVQQFSSTGAFIRRLGGSASGSGNGEFFGARGIAVSADGDVWVADTRNHRIQRFSSSGQYLAQFGSYGTGNGQFNEPSAIEVKPSGHLLVTDRRNSRIVQFTPAGEFVLQFGTKGTGIGQMREPQGIAISPGGDIYIADSTNHRMQRWK